MTTPKWRLRYKDERVLRPYSWTADVLDKYYVGCSGAASWRTYSSGTGTFGLGKYTAMSDVVTPGYDKISKTGGIVMNPMELVSVEVTDGGGTTPETVALTPSCTGSGEYYPVYRWPITGISAGAWRSGMSLFTGAAPGWYPAHSMVMDSGDYARMLSEVSTCVHNKRGRSNSNMFESLAQADKTLTLLPTLFNSIRQAVQSKAGQPWLKRLQGVSAAYLLYRYGIKPLVGDVQNVMGALALIEGRIRETQRCNASAETRSEVSSSSSFMSHLPYTTRVSSTEVISVRAMSLDEYDLTRSFYAGLTAKDLATVTWELIPFSFVIDWFVNIGEYLGAITPTPFISNRGACTVVRRTRTDLFTITGNTAPSGIRIQAPLTGSCVKTSTHVTRSPTLAGPGLVVKSDFRFDRLTRAGDAVALLINALRRNH